MDDDIALRMHATVGRFFRAHLLKHPDTLLGRVMFHMNLNVSGTIKNSPHGLGTATRARAPLFFWAFRAAVLKHNAHFDFDLLDCHFTPARCQGAEHFDAEVDGGDVLVVTALGRRSVTFENSGFKIDQNTPGQFYRMRGSSIKHAVTYHGETSQFIFRRSNAPHTTHPPAKIIMPTSREVLCALHVLSDT
jgi:hypothetical protein